MRVFLDIDGVVADFIGGACRLHNVANPYLDPNGPRGDEAWEVLDYIDVEPEAFWGSMGFEFWAGLDETKDGRDIVRCAEYLFGPQSICFLSSPCRTIGCGEGKRAWLERHYPGYPLLLSVATGSSVPPKSFVSQEESILVDDSYANVKAFSAHGGSGVLVPRPWNRKHDDIGWASHYVATQLGARRGSE